MQQHNNNVVLQHYLLRYSYVQCVNELFTSRTILQITIQYVLMNLGRPYSLKSNASLLVLYS